MQSNISEKNFQSYNKNDRKIKIGSINIKGPLLNSNV